MGFDKTKGLGAGGSGDSLTKTFVGGAELPAKPAFIAWGNDPAILRADALTANDGITDEDMIVAGEVLVALGHEDRMAEFVGDEMASGFEDDEHDALDCLMK